MHEKLPKIKFIDYQATYMVWLDFNEYGFTDEELERRIFKEAKVALDGGTWFGECGSGFMRINIACPRSMLKEGLERMAKAFE